MSDFDGVPRSKISAIHCQFIALSCRQGLSITTQNTFPSPKEIQQYLDDTASSVADLIRLNTRVSNLRYTVPQDGGHQRRWTITATPISSSQTASLSTDEQFDLVVAANGHYARPFVPHIEGANIFQGKVIHARWYRGPEAFQGKVCPCATQGGGARKGALNFDYRTCWW